MIRRRRPRLESPAALSIAAVAVGLAFGGCDRGDSTSPRHGSIFERTRPSDLKVLLIGIDGATFDVADPLLKAGNMPTLARLIERGSYARLRSENPMLSPAIWTTIATGMPRRLHQIHDFLSRGRGDAAHPVLTSTADRKTLAIWNLVGPFAKSVGVIGWWVTWPAEPVRGFVVSDRVAHSRWQSWTAGPTDRNLTYPESLIDEIKTLVVDPMKPPMDEIGALADWTESERKEMLGARHPIPFHGPSVLKFGYCEQRTYENVALRLLPKGQPDLSLVFLIATDPISHTFWHYFQPAAFRAGVDADAARRLGRVIPGMYEHNDRYLSALLSAVDPKTVVIIVSDHGFQPSGKLPSETTSIDYREVGIERTESLGRPVNVGMTGIHHLDGFFAASGGPIRKGAVPTTQPTVLDVTPTILALMGLPVARDMPGRVLTELIEPEFLAKHPVTYIDSYEDYIDRAAISQAAQGDESQRLEYLKSLGYIGESTTQPGMLE